MPEKLEYLIFIPEDDAALTNVAERQALDTKTGALLYSLYDEVIPILQRTLNPGHAVSKSDRVNQGVAQITWEPAARSSTLELLFHLTEEGSPQRIDASTWAEAALGKINRGIFQSETGLKTEERIGAAVRETAKTIISCGLIRNQVTVLLRSKPYTLATAS